MNIYNELGVTPVINAAGTLTRFSGSLMHPEVTDAMAAASRSFVDMNELHTAAGTRIAELVGVEAAHVCASATAGIALMAAACMAGATILPPTMAYYFDPQSVDDVTDFFVGKVLDVLGLPHNLYRRWSGGG